MKQTINLRQMACIAGFLVFANKVLVLPSLFYDKVGVDGIFTLLMLFFLDLTLLFAFFKLKQVYPKESFFQILSNYLSKYIAIILYSLICLFFLIKSLLVYNVALLYLKNQVYFEAGEYIFPICFLTVSNSIVIKGLRGLGRTCEFFYIFTIIMVNVWIFSASVNFAGVPILFNNSFLQIGKSAFSYLFAFGDFLFFFLIMDKIEYKKEKVKKVFFYVIANMIIVSFLFAIFYSVFRYTGSMHNNAASDVITFSNKYSGIGRIDIIAIIVVMILDYFHLSTYNMAFNVAFQSIFPKENENIPIILYDLLFLILLIFVIPNYVVAIDISVYYFCYVALIIEYFVPFLLTFVSFFKKKRRKYEKVF